MATVSHPLAAHPPPRSAVKPCYVRNAHRGSTTPEANKTIVRRCIDELNYRNLAIQDELVADEFRQVVRQGYHRNVTAFPDTFVEIYDLELRRLAHGLGLRL